MYEPLDPGGTRYMTDEEVEAVVRHFAAAFPGLRTPLRVQAQIAEMERRVEEEKRRVAAWAPPY